MITKEDNIEKLYDILKLDYDWNGYGAEPIPLQVIFKVKSLIKVFNIQPEIFPTGSESIQLEWENDNYYFEIDIYKNEEISCILQDKANDKILEIHEIDDGIKFNNANEINDYLKKYFKGDSEKLCQK